MSRTTTTALRITQVTASGNDGNLPSNTIDGNFSTRWSCLGKGSWIRYDLGSAQAVASLDIAWYKGNTRKSKFVISFSADARTWTNVLTATSSGATAALEKYMITTAGSARYVKITVNGNSVNDWASITETKIFGGAVATTPPPSTTTTTPSGGFTKSGIKLLATPKSGGFYWELDLSKDPNQDPNFSTEGDKCTAKQEGNVKFYNMQGHTVTYASGAPSGVTNRLSIYFDGGKGQKQNYTWQNQPGFLWKSGDPKSFIVISTIRPHRSLASTIHHEASIKMRGGLHSGSNDPRASTVELTHELKGKATARWAREFNHPRYDYKPADKSGANTANLGMETDRWFMRQVISKLLPDGSGVSYEMYVNVNPFNPADGSVNNDNWQLYSQTIDKSGLSTGNYNKAATWSAFLTTCRTDGWQDIDIGPHAFIEI